MVSVVESGACPTPKLVSLDAGASLEKIDLRSVDVSPILDSNSMCSGSSFLKFSEM